MEKCAKFKNSSPITISKPNCCIICNINYRCIGILDCGHYLLCYDCGCDLIRSINPKCPKCHSKIKRMQIIYE